MKHSIISFDGHRVHAKAVACGFLLIVAGAQAGLGQQPAAASGTAARAALPANSPAPVSSTSANASEGPGQSEYSEAAKPAKTRGEGIQIHGHWVLEVKTADGKVKDRREFENSLVTTYTVSANQNTSTTSGATYLAAALSGNIAPGLPAIGFVQGALAGDPSLWCAPAPYVLTSPKITCYTYTTANSLWNNPQVLSAGSSGDVSIQLGLSQSVGYVPTANMVLSGNYTVPAGLTSISAVQTLLGGCVTTPNVGVYGFFSLNPLGNLVGQGGNNLGVPGTMVGNEFGFEDVAPKVCTQSAINTPANTDVEVLGALTSTAVTAGTTASPLSVTAGEIVAVTVTISFS
jgi:hypothetical protein